MQQRLLHPGESFSRSRRHRPRGRYARLLRDSMRLPPLNTLQAFEAVARHVKVREAARELHLTESAVGKQIRRLEQLTGTRLFDRAKDGLHMTAEGRMLLFSIQASLAALEQAIPRPASARSPARIAITTTPSLATRWLARRLRALEREGGDTQIVLSTNRQLVTLQRGVMDLAVRYGHGQWPGVESVPLCAGRLVPVCAPALLGRRQRSVTAAELAKMPLLHDMSAQYWGRFFRTQSVRAEQSRTVRVYDDSNVVIQLAIEGEGVALQSPILVQDDIAAGRLVIPGNMGMSCDLSYHLACPAGSAQDPVLARIMQWLLAEGARSTAA